VHGVVVLQHAIGRSVSAGIAPNRAEAIRWSLARISERPAYAQLRERTREIERLKSEF
jgi:hypothetical protein